MSVHLNRPGIACMVLTALSQKMKNIVFGMNDSDVISNDRILSDHVKTVHAYTNDQNLIDNMHQCDRCIRAERYCDSCACDGCVYCRAKFELHSRHLFKKSIGFLKKHHTVRSEQAKLTTVKTRMR